MFFLCAVAFVFSLFPVWFSPVPPSNDIAFHMKYAMDILNEGGIPPKVHGFWDGIVGYPFVSHLMLAALMTILTPQIAVKLLFTLMWGLSALVMYLIGSQFRRGEYFALFYILSAGKLINEFIYGTVARSVASVILVLTVYFLLTDRPGVVAMLFPVMMFTHATFPLTMLALLSVYGCAKRKRWVLLVSLFFVGWWVFQYWDVVSSYNPHFNKVYLLTKPFSYSIKIGGLPLVDALGVFLIPFLLLSRNSYSKDKVMLWLFSGVVWLCVAIIGQTAFSLVAAFTIPFLLEGGNGKDWVIVWLLIFSCYTFVAPFVGEFRETSFSVDDKAMETIQWLAGQPGNTTVVPYYLGDAWIPFVTGFKTYTCFGMEWTRNPVNYELFYKSHTSNCTEVLDALSYLKPTFVFFSREYRQLYDETPITCFDGFDKVFDNGEFAVFKTH
ncbi:MAG: hypothetical protein DRN81_05485 [Thermoproteota archaeon]|nr:MAG: hypothetical protein DRN81_05485 [Candidatus Korarchaeota archaeon]